MAANQKSEDFRIEDWAIPEDELPWNAPAAAAEDKPTADVIELEQYRRQKRNTSNTD